MPTRCFLLEPTGMVRRWLRRYTEQHAGSTWTCAGGWHEAMVPFGDAPAIWEERADNYGWVHKVVRHAEADKPPDDDPRWPTKCDRCDYRFTPSIVRQFFYDLLYRMDTGEITTLRDAPPGAMWNAWWLQDLKPGGVIPGPSPDGLRLMVKCPNGREWFIDGRASNCGSPKDDNHACWVRHGTPPDLVVDKAGVTCNAGAGSIAAGDYHGFLGTNGAPPGWFT